MIVYLIWLLIVIAWNYGVPNAAPFEDVVMAMIIGFIAYKLKYENLFYLVSWCNRLEL